MISTLCWFDFTPFCFLLSCCSELGLFLCHEGQESKVEQHKQQSRFISPSHRKSRDRGGSVVARFSADCFLLSALLSGISASSQGSSSTGLQSVCQNQSGPHSPTATGFRRLRTCCWGAVSTPQSTWATEEGGRGNACRPTTV